MKGNKSFYTKSLWLAIVVFGSCFIGQKLFYSVPQNVGHGDVVSDTEYGAFLAAQHALYVNDFDNAALFAGEVKSDISLVKTIKNTADFFAGRMPEDVSDLKDSKDLVERLIYDTHLIQKDDWKGVYDRHKNDDSVISGPIRFFSTWKHGKNKDAIKAIDSLNINDPWKAFMRGQIAILNNDIDGAAKEFATIHPDFLNVNDYLYLMSFYQHNGMVEDMEILKNDFIAKPGGMYILDYPEIPDWSNYDGIKNNLVFSIIQIISHTQVMIYSDLSLTFLRFAEIISNDTNLDAINYYLGQYYFYNNGDYKKSFENIEKQSPLYLFGQLKIAEKENDIKTIEKIARENPLFIVAVNTIIREHIKNGDKKHAIKLINRGLKQKRLTDYGRVYFLKQRVHVNLMFNDINSAEDDMAEIKSIDVKITPDVMLLQARIWEKQNRNLDEAYNYAMTLIKMNASDVNAWDLLGLIVDKKEGVMNAIEIMEQITNTGTGVSSVYEHMGDLYLKMGDKDKALRAYRQAIDLSDDCLIVVPLVQKKIRKLK